MEYSAKKYRYRDFVPSITNCSLPSIRQSHGFLTAKEIDQVKSIPILNLEEQEVLVKKQTCPEIEEGVNILYSPYIENNKPNGTVIITAFCAHTKCPHNTGQKS